MKNVGELVKLVIRRERIVLSVWGLIFGLLPVGIAGGFDALYPTEAQIGEAAALMTANPAFVALLGEVYAPTLGGLTAWRALAPLTLAVGMVSVLAVVRHTRAEEQSGRRELIASTVLGRDAPLAAALIVVWGADLLIGVVAAVSLAVYGLNPLGALAFGAAVAGAGWVFAAVAALAAQVAESAVTANGLGLSVVGGSFVMRMVGDAGGGSSMEVLSWLSPIGLAQRVRPFADERPTLLLILLLTGSAVALAARFVSRRRDVGAGLMAPRPGPPAASPTLAGPAGLAWRIQGGEAVGWLVGFALVGLMIGTVTDSFVELMLETPALAAIISRVGGTDAIADGLLGAMFSLFGVAAAAHGVRAALWLRTEEVEGRAETVLSTRVGRGRWMASHAVVAFTFPVVDLLVAGTAAGFAYGVSVGDLSEVGRVGTGALATVPAVWLMTGSGLALFGALPRRTRAAWSLVGAAGLLTILGRAVGLDQWVLDLSPFTHIPPMPGGDLTWTPLIWMTFGAAALIGFAYWSFHHRDLEGT